MRSIVCLLLLAGCGVAPAADLGKINRSLEKEPKYTGRPNYCLLVFGAEGKGVRPLVRRACDAAVSIPLDGKVESLNVSVAAALLLYETARQRAAARAHA